MKLGTLRRDGGTVAVRIDADEAVELGVPDVGALLQDPDWRTRAADGDGARHPLADLTLADWAPVVPNPGKVVCIGLNYRAHILEMGRQLPEHPTLFSKYPEALIGAGDPIEVPSYAGGALDWEGELAVIMGATARRASEDEAASTIAGYAVLNDLTMRDWQYRTPEWLQGKSFENTTPFGPYLVTSDEWTPGPELRTVVNGDTVQQVGTDDLVFAPEALVSYISQVFPLQPGDVIASGTPGGVGHARKPPRYLSDGDVLETVIEGLGRQRNDIVVPRDAD
ncbi:fumarylacetoacetate hydrolase family protein [Naasia sp. SYSU D00948]|uniref:fumarylacetoacetate hydrolase family protein n=1 Tax=Naasia sp. SYSU D00948 TaxID=2817379 RepID=UPI001B3063F3|nr:fumarylacetoacetate hydrolase family protein [Naasia sp. SYSU D00948]